MMDQIARTRPLSHRWIGAALFGLAVLLPAQALADDAVFDGPVFWSESGVGVLLDEAQSCKLDMDAFSVTQEVYEARPRTDAERAALEARLSAIGDLAGFGADPGHQTVNRAFLRRVLTSRMLLTLSYDANRRQEGMACLERWLTREGFRRVRAQEADAIRAARSE